MLSHYRNSHAAVGKWEVVNPSLFEVTILPPDAVNADGTINEKIIRTVIYPIIVTELELDAD